MINYNLKINFQDEKVLSSDLVFVSGDVGAYKLIFDFYDNGKKVDISDCALVIRAKRADGSVVSGAGEIVGGQGMFIPDNSIFSVPGELYMEVALCGKAQKYATTKIVVAEVLEGIGKNCEPSTNEVSVFVTLMGQIQSKIEYANKLIGESAGKRTENDGEIFGDYENNEAVVPYSHAEGTETKAYGYASHAEGIGTKTSGAAQHVQGRYNAEDTDGVYAHIVGGGMETSHKNIHTLDWNGTGWFAGEIKIGGTGQEDPNSEVVATKKDIDEIVNEISSVLDELHLYAESLISGGAE